MTAIPAFAALSLVWGIMLAAPWANAAAQAINIAVVASVSGPSEFAGHGLVDAVRFAVDEANAAGGSPVFELKVYDDTSDEKKVREVARQAASTDTLIVIGPASSNLALAACPIFAEAGLADIDATAHADEVTNNATTFRTVMSTGQIGDGVANYLGRILKANHAMVIYKDNGYGRPVATYFKQAADRLGISATYQPYASPAQREDAVRLALANPDQPPLVLGMTYEDAAPALITLRRQGYKGIILGTTTMARGSFVDLFSKEPEERQTKGYFTNGAYAVSPMILDSANAETLAFADRFQKRYGREPSWESVQGYDAARLAMAALRAVLASGSETGADQQSRRKAVCAYLASRNSPANALTGLTGPLWFTPGRFCQQAVRMGRFHAGVFESAPVQIVPVTTPDPSELADGSVFELEPQRFARLQRVVYTGIYINEVPYVDLSKSSFGADFYLWLRFAKEAGPNSPDPTDIIFPNLLSGGVDQAHPAEQYEMTDGTEYRLWRVQGEFRNDFDLHRYPFDRQSLSLSLSNARAAADRIVYVLDRRSSLGQPHTPSVTVNPVGTPSLAASTAFRNLTQWDSLGANQRRENLVTESALGDLRRVGAESYRELSGFLVTVELQRRAVATLAKTLLPLFLMTGIMFASLYFPAALVKEKVTVAITGALSGAVLLTAINTQLGGVGYTIAAEYVFYVFFCLSLLCIVAVLSAERFRAASKPGGAVAVDHWARRIFLLAVLVTVVVVGFALARAG